MKNLKKPLSPSNANSNGAAGYFYLDTTGYANGVHSIQWTAKDNAGNIDGIGSRYFTIANTGGTSSQMKSGVFNIQLSMLNVKHVEISSNPVDYSEPIGIRKGFRENERLQEIYPDDSGVLDIKIRELERVEIHLDRTAWRMAQSSEQIVKTKMEGGPVNHNWMGFLVIGDQLRTLPVGSTLDREKGIFYWQPGVGFVGDYEFVFVSTGEINKRKVKIRVKILPKIEIKNSNKGHQVKNPNFTLNGCFNER